MPMRYDAGAAAYDELTGRDGHASMQRLPWTPRMPKWGVSVLDLATGTGDAAYIASRRIGPKGFVVGADLSVAMLLVGARKATLHNGHL